MKVVAKAVLSCVITKEYKANPKKQQKNKKSFRLLQV
jgi:hypothetical protein